MGLGTCTKRFPDLRDLVHDTQQLQFEYKISRAELRQKDGSTWIKATSTNTISTSCGHPHRYEEVLPQHGRANEYGSWRMLHGMQKPCNSKHLDHISLVYKITKSKIFMTHRGHIGHSFVLPIFIMPHLLPGINCFLQYLLQSCLIPHACENVRPQVTCHTCFQVA